MFLVNYFKYAFDFPNIIGKRKEPFIKVFIFFILLILLSNLPHVYTIVVNEGWAISFVEESFKQETPAFQTFELPSHMSIHYYGLETSDDLEHIIYYGDYMFVFNAQSEHTTDLQQVLLKQDEIIYIDSEGHQLVGSYRGFSEVYDFDSVMLDASNWQSNMMLFASNIEAGFSQYIILYSLLTYTGVQLLTTMILIAVLGLILQMFRFGHSYFMTYFEGLKMLVFTLPIPVIIGFIVGFFMDSLTPFIVQFGMGMITMLVMMKFGKYHFNG